MIEKINDLKSKVNSNEVKSLCETAISLISSSIYNGVNAEAKLEIEKMIGGLKSNSIFMGARGQAAIDQKSLIEAIARLAQLAGDFPQIKELDINPLLLTAQGVKVLDARIVIE